MNCNRRKLRLYKRGETLKILTQYWIRKKRNRMKICLVQLGRNTNYKRMKLKEQRRGDTLYIGEKLEVILNKEAENRRE